MKPGGRLATDIYQKVPLRWGDHLNLLKSKYFLRRWTTKVNPQKLERIVDHYVNMLWPLFKRIMKSGHFGLLVSQLFLFNDWGKLCPSPIDVRFEKDLAKVMIYDMLSPAFDIPATQEEFYQWHLEAGLEDIDIHPGYNGLEGRAVKKL